MSCNCLAPDAADNWRELASANPRNPLDIIANATLNGNTGLFLNSTTFATPPSIWHAAGSPVALTANPTDAALGSDQQINVANANQWQFKKPTWNSDTKIAPPLRKLIYLRGGNQWAMSIPLTIGATQTSDIHLAFMENAATRGDHAGTIPVISWSGSVYTGTLTLLVTLLPTQGDFWMGLRIVDTSSNWSMYDSLWRVIP